MGSKRTEYEYKLVDLNYTDEDGYLRTYEDDDLNDQVPEGWRIVNVFRDKGDLIAILERERDDEVQD